MAEPRIICSDEGFHNANWERTQKRLRKARSYADCSTIMVVPAIKPIPPRVYTSHMGIMGPMNQKFIKMAPENMEVGDAYNATVQFILGNPELSTWRYILTVETDNLVPPDALLKLIEDIESGPYDAVGALYWTKGEGGQPMCYGNPKVMPKNFIPWLPEPDTVSPTNGVGMGCTLFRLEFFKKMPAPWFKTVQEVIPGQGARSFTQDLWHFEEGAKYGERVACSTRVLSGHYDYLADIVW